MHIFHIFLVVFDILFINLIDLWVGSSKASCIPDDATFSIAVLAAARAKNFTMVVEWLREAHGVKPYC